jgi:polysaccharide biosynthesis/export protein
MKALGVLLLMGSTLITVSAQQAQVTNARQPTTTVSASSGSIVLPDEEYLIGSTDVVEVSVLKMPELSREYRVEADGTIQMPFLGQIKAEKKTTRQLAAAIAKELEGGYLIDPQVSVMVKEVNRRYFVEGGVRMPGVYNIEGRPTLLELITIAGGLDITHGSTAFIIRKTPADGNAEATYEMKTANLATLLRGEFSENIKIEPGDIVQIPPSDVFFVAGEVMAPGSFPLKEGTTLRQAISLARNTTMTSAPNKAVIFRENGSKEKKQIPVDITDVMRGRKPDVPIVANDVIVVPSSKAKSVYMPVLNSFGVNIAYGAARVIIP